MVDRYSNFERITISNTANSIPTYAMLQIMYLSFHFAENFKTDHTSFYCALRVSPAFGEMESLMNSSVFPHSNLKIQTKQVFRLEGRMCICKYGDIVIIPMFLI